MTTSTSMGHPNAGTARPSSSDGRWSRVLRALAPGMATMAMLTGAPFSRTVWAGLLTQRYGVQVLHHDDHVSPGAESRR